MEFLDEESRPRLLFQSRSSSTTEPKTLDIHKPTIFISLSISSILFILSLFYIQSDPLKSIIFWFSLSLLLGPFAPTSLTAGDIRVGQGPPLIQPPPPPSETNSTNSNNKSSNRRSSKPRKQDDLGIPVVVNNTINSQKQEEGEDDNSGDLDLDQSRVRVVAEEREWSEGDLELLKKQMVKYPVGMPGRWEAIAEGFGGRHGVESVIKEVKSMGGKKGKDLDSFSRFLKDRKPVDKRVEDELAAENNELRKDTGGGGGGWSGGEDIALLNALKAFPKEVPMRWEKITAAVPGRSKAACMKRVADMKRDFRSSKASAEG
ncbi:hypothetical protein LguiB_006843 [Lonicera macranthoides]